MLPYVLACLCCLAIAVGIELDIPTENELFENACRLKNNTLFKLFKENVTSRRRINNVTNSKCLYDMIRVRTAQDMKTINEI